MTDRSPGPKEWQDVDASGRGAEAITYLDATANALSTMRLRSHELLGIEGGATVLDVGCGTGIALAELAQLVGPTGCTVGIDPSSAMLAEARTRLEGAPGDVELVLGTATDTGQPDGRFDAVRTERVLMHVPDAAGAMAELARVTRPGGRVVMVEPDHRRLAIDSDDPDFVVRLATVFSRVLANGSAGLRARSDAIKAGLRVESVEPITYSFQSFDAFREVFDLSVARPFLLEDGVEEARLDSFLDELVERDGEGRFLAVGVMYLVTAVKG
jgi:ubiquinone/menaquinone biosynthesis C-methylase UbiE